MSWSVGWRWRSARVIGGCRSTPPASPRRPLGKMLRQFHRPGVVVIGLRVTEQPPWDAHAWLLGSRGALTGGPAARGFTATTVFELPAGVRAEGVDLSVS